MHKLVLGRGGLGLHSVGAGDHGVCKLSGERGGAVTSVIDRAARVSTRISSFRAGL